MSWCQGTKGQLSQKDLPRQTTTVGSIHLKWMRNPIARPPGKWPQRRGKHKPPGRVSSVGLRQNHEEGMDGCHGLRLCHTRLAVRWKTSVSRAVNPALFNGIRSAFKNSCCGLWGNNYSSRTLLKVASDRFFLMDGLMLGYLIFCDSTFWGRRRECKPEACYLLFFFFKQNFTHRSLSLSKCFWDFYRRDNFVSYAWLENVPNEDLNQQFLKL